MATTSLFFATNRKHKGKDRWQPTGYGKDFSSDGMQNLRFGNLTLEANESRVKKFMNEGDGEELAGYLARKAKKAIIEAYEDKTSITKAEIPSEKNSSTKMFRKLKTEMEKSADVVVYIHGYNVSWEQAVGAAVALQYMLNRKREPNQKKVLVVLFSWPSDGSMIPFMAYRSDRADAEGSGHAVGRAMLKLHDFLLKLSNTADSQKDRPCEQEIHLLCHSMGNYVLQNALAKLIEHSVGPCLPRIFDHLFLCAADVNDDVLETNHLMSRLHEICKNITVYFNKGDMALLISDHTKGHPERLGHAGNAHPYLVHNKIHQVDCSPIVHGPIEHSYYLWATVNDDIHLSVEGVEFDDTSRHRKRRGNSNEWVLV